MNRAYLSLGSNINPDRYLPRAIEELRQFGEIAATSRVWETEPAGDPNQANFLNAAALLLTPLTAEELYRDAIKPIEAKLCRVRDPRNRNAPRTIDIDLSLFNDEIFTVGHHHIPDPDLLTRGFVAVPLAEVDANYRHPESRRTLQDIAEDFADEVGRTMTPRPDVVLLTPGDKTLYVERG